MYSTENQNKGQCLVLHMYDVCSSSFSTSLLLKFNPLTCSHACWGASCSCSPERCLHRISHGGSSHWHQVDRDASVLDTVTHGILSSSAFYFSCLVGLAYSSLKSKRHINTTLYNFHSIFWVIRKVEDLRAPSNETNPYCTNSSQKYSIKNALQIVTDH